MDSCTNIKYIGMLATGYNVVDYKAAKERAFLYAISPLWHRMQ